MVKQIIFTALMLMSSVAMASGFVNVQNGQTIRANGGEVVIIVKSSPDEHQLFINQAGVTVDAAAFSSELNQTAYVLKDVSRGKHKIILAIGSYREEITVTVQRVHQ